MKLSEENIEGKFHDNRYSNYLLDMTPKAQSTKVKVDKTP